MKGSMLNMVGGSIGRGRVVHHKDGNKSNFRRSNLFVMSRSDHSSLHIKKKRWFWQAERG
ncbi:MAG: HNH endonuclease [Candidatus Methanomethylicaceae archaeon]|jgi:hypothetical protein